MDIPGDWRLDTPMWLLRHCTRDGLIDRLDQHYAAHPTDGRAAMVRLLREWLRANAPEYARRPYGLAYCVHLSCAYYGPLRRHQ